MKEVTKEQFYGEIYERHLNVHVRVTGNYPYTSVFSFPNGTEWGRIEPIPEDNVIPYFWKERYLISG